jgi:hypothetical protein
MYFVGPVSPPSSSGNKYILTISDYFTKFSFARALPTKEAFNVVDTLRQVKQLASYVLICPYMHGQHTEIHMTLNIMWNKSNLSSYLSLQLLLCMTRDSPYQFSSSYIHSYVCAIHPSHCSC